ncbi:hypothetical protein ACIA8C_05245 [Nocardia sp. NPDC051321]|uniref:hypothetical protein n=1 Tax=Nocardia sp. NPDC051321 TaxID=3364323 RepID=UPI0037B1140A
MPAATVYTCRVTNWSMFGINVSLLASQCIYFWIADGAWWAVSIVAASLLLNLAMSVLAISQRVTASPAGLAVSLGPFGIPRVRMARTNITHAEQILSTMQLPSTPGVFRRGTRGWFLLPKLGPALRLRLASGRTVTVSMPEPAAAMRAMGIAP